MLKSVIKYLELQQQENLANLKQFMHLEILDSEARIRADLAELKSDLRKRKHVHNSLQKQVQM